MKHPVTTLRFIGIILTLSVSISCMNSDHAKQPESLSYMPLGDSYTIGTGGTEGNSWPELLVRHLNDSGIEVELIDNPARNGYTCRDLIDYELPVLFRKKPDFVTICIGTNDWIAGYDSAGFTNNLRYVLDTVQATLKVKTNIVLLTVPDFSLTKSGKLYGNGRNIPEGLQRFNAIIKAEAAARNLKCVDIFAVSQQVKNDPWLISEDNLHPSDKGYALWEKEIFPVVSKVIQPSVKPRQN
ncbi:MAG: SGNH/GDSL hydrolase family protein [Bacteroidia bacterium]|nr:SGNH/GDSL hydrolase family protein [Bacteroidia bacterium]